MALSHSETGHFSISLPLFSYETACERDVRAYVHVIHQS